MEQEHTMDDLKVQENASVEGLEGTGAADVHPGETIVVEPHKDSDELQRLQEQITELNDRLLRSQADFENFRRRTRLEKEELLEYGSVRLLGALLPALDNMELAIRAGQEIKDVDSLMKGIDMVFRQLQELLTNEGLEPIEAVGQPFDPNLHEAVMQVESDTYPPGTVTEEMRKGYRLKNKVIRPAMVKVSL